MHLSNRLLSSLVCIRLGEIRGAAAVATRRILTPSDPRRVHLRQSAVLQVRQRQRILSFQFQQCPDETSNTAHRTYYISPYMLG